jgi:hypothetical protein
MLNDNHTHFSGSKIKLQQSNQNQQSAISNEFNQHSAFSISKFARTIQLPARLQQGGRDCTAAFHWNKRGTSSSAAVNSITSLPFWRYDRWTGTLTAMGLMLRCAKWATEKHGATEEHSSSLASCLVLWPVFLCASVA